jgi:hypothetical protein
MSYTSEFPSEHRKYQRLKHDPKTLINLKDYCALVHCGRKAAMYRIYRKQIVGYKLRGRWWVVPPVE